MNDPVEARLRRYIEEVMRFRRALNLTSIDDPDEFGRRFVAPSVALARWMPEAGVLLDIGSGMGVPGVPLLIACPGLRGVLVERRRKRAEFLRHLARALPLDATVHDKDVRALPPIGADVCVARAVADQQALLAMCAPHMRDGGLAVLPVPKDSRPADTPGWRCIGEERIMAGDEQLIRRYRFWRETARTQGGGFT